MSHHIDVPEKDEEEGLTSVRLGEAHMAKLLCLDVFSGLFLDLIYGLVWSDMEIRISLTMLDGCQEWMLQIHCDWM